MTTESKALVLAPRTGIVVPAVDTEGAVAAWNAYVALCKAVIGPEDVQRTWDGDFRKKSAFRKLARFYDLTDRVVESNIERDDRGRPIFAAFTVRATAPNGREAEGYHECHLSERCCPGAFGDPCDRAKFNKKHKCCLPICSGWTHWSHPGDIPATAHTRAKNRAISDLIGAGEVSAEEVGNAVPEDASIDSEGPVTAHRPAPQEAPRGFCPDHPDKPFVERKSKDGGTWWTCGTRIGERDGKTVWCQQRPAVAPAMKPEAPAGVVAGEARLVQEPATSGPLFPDAVIPAAAGAPIATGRQIVPKSLAELMQRAKNELGLPFVEVKKVLGIKEPMEIADINDAWTKLCVAKAKESKP